VQDGPPREDHRDQTENHRGEGSTTNGDFQHTSFLVGHEPLCPCDAARLAELGIDSLDLVELVMELEESFD
jgi:hypothetical protein